MKTLTIQIKNMVCPRCVYVVGQVLSNLGLDPLQIDLGYAVIDSSQETYLDRIDASLREFGLELVRDSNGEIITGIERAIHLYLDRIGTGSQNMSDFLSKNLARNYNQLSKIYKAGTGSTIEQYFIKERINRVKELIRQSELNLSQIAISLGYSSIYYLSAQFKKYTGESLSTFKKKWNQEIRNAFDKSDPIMICSCGKHLEKCICKSNHDDAIHINLYPDEHFTNNNRRSNSQFMIYASGS